jgi:hypothetical protein
MEGKLMPYDQELDERLLKAIAGWGPHERKCQAEAEQALSRPHVKPFDLTGKPMNGWIRVEKAGLNDQALGQWLAEARRFVATLPPK